MCYATKPISYVRDGCFVVAGLNDGMAHTLRGVADLEACSVADLEACSDACGVSKARPKHLLP